MVLKRNLDRGALVQVRVGAMILLGEVRYCAKGRDGFNIGIQLEDVVSS